MASASTDVRPLPDPKYSIAVLNPEEADVVARMFADYVGAVAASRRSLACSTGGPGPSSRRAPRHRILVAQLHPHDASERALPRRLPALRKKLRRSGSVSCVNADLTEVPWWSSPSGASWKRTSGLPSRNGGQASSRQRVAPAQPQTCEASADRHSDVQLPVAIAGVPRVLDLALLVAVTRGMGDQIAYEREEVCSSRRGALAGALHRGRRSPTVAARRAGTIMGSARHER